MNGIKRPVAATVLFTFLAMVLQPLSVVAQDRPLPLQLSKPAAPRPESREDRFSTTLAEIHDLLKEVAPDAAMPHMFSRSKQEMELRAIGPGMRIEVERAKPAAGVDVAAKVMQIRGKAKELANLEEHVRTAFEESEKQIKDKNLPAEMLVRHQAALASYNARYAEFKALLGAVERAASAGDAPLQTALSDLGAFMAKYPNKKIHAPTDPGKLPFGSPKPVIREPYTSPSQFRTSKLFGDPVIVAQSGSLSGVSLPGVTLPATPVPADTAPTEDVQITQAIRDLAASLGNNPVQIYNWVRNNIQFVPTYGSIQGSDVTLLTKRGNAFDTASLLIAVLRAANVPSRYVYGTVQVPATQVMNWVGGVSVPHAAIELMGQGGIPAAGVNSGGQVTAIRFEHVWVEAFVDYLPSRGAINRAPNTWVPLDAAFKQYQFTAPLDLTGAPFNANQLVSDVQQGTIVNEAEGWVQNINQPLIQQSLVNYQAQFDSHVSTQKPNATVADVLGDKTVAQENRPILLGTLPYRTIVVGSRFQSIPNSLRHRISLKLFASDFEVADDSPTMSYSAGIPALAGKRISFTYRPASTADQVVIDSAAAARASTFPAYLVRFAPTIKVEDAVVASAGGFTTGQPQMLVVTLHGPWEDRARTYHVQAGDFWVLGLNPAGATREMWTSRTQQRNLVDLDERDPAEMLHQIALGWWAQKYTLNDIFGATHGVMNYQMPSHALAGTPLTLRFSFGIARSASYKSRVLDAKEDTVVAVHSGGDVKARRAFLLAAGQAGSYLEAGIFDQAFFLPPGQSMSAMTALKAASDGGLRIYTITQNNAFALGHIQTAPDDLQDMQNAVAAGLKVTTAQRDITSGGFTGLGYFFWELFLEWTAALRAIRRDVHPRGHRGGIYPFMRAAMCVVVRDLIVYGVLSDMMKGRPAIYATFSSYDEVAHHSGLERADTLEALRKLDQQFGRIDRARRYTPRPFEIVVLSDHGQTQGATFKQRNGYGLDDLVARSLTSGDVADFSGGDEQHAMVGLAVSEATGTDPAKKRPKNDVSDRDVVVLGSGNLGLVYLMEEKRRLSLEEIEERHPRLLPALREHPHVGWVLVRSSEHGAVVLGGGGAHYLADDRVEGVDPLADFSPNASRHLARTDQFPDVADLMIGSFYDPQLDEGCAFEELISFHGGMGGPQTRPFILFPPTLPPPDEPLVGAASVHALLRNWRLTVQASG